MFLLGVPAGCGSDAGLAPADEPPAETVRLMSFPDHPRKAFLDVFSEAGLPFELDIIEVPQNQYEEKVRMLLFTGEAPELILVDTPNVASYAEIGTLEPLNEYWDAGDFDDITDSCRTSLQWNGRIWAAPLNEADCVLFYNKAVFRSEGIRPAETLGDAWTLERLLEVSRQLTQADAATGEVTRYGILPSMFTPDNKNEGMAYTQMLFVWWFGGEILSPDGTTASGYFDSPQSVEAVRFYADLFGRHKVAPREEIQNGFRLGKIAMCINGPWLLGAWKDSDPEFYESGWGAMPLPRGIAAASASGSWNIAITKACGKKAEAWQAIAALTGQEGMRSWCRSTGNIPARKSILESDPMYKTEAPYNIISEQLMHTGRPRPVLSKYPEISNALVDCFNSAAFGEDPETAARRATARMNEALAGKRDGGGESVGERGGGGESVGESEGESGDERGGGGAP
jgi:fructooligosaccharide transport system substrate-binding protein